MLSCIFAGVYSSGPVHISSRGRGTKSEIRHQPSQNLQPHDGNLFNEVDKIDIVGPSASDKRVIRGQFSPPNGNTEHIEPDYSPDILDNGKL